MLGCYTQTPENFHNHMYIFMVLMSASKRARYTSSMINQTSHFGIMGGLGPSVGSGQQFMLRRARNIQRIPPGAKAGKEYMVEHDLLSKNPAGSAKIGRTALLVSRVQGPCNCSRPPLTAPAPICPAECKGCCSCGYAECTRSRPSCCRDACAGVCCATECADAPHTNALQTGALQASVAFAGCTTGTCTSQSVTVVQNTDVYTGPDKLPLNTIQYKVFKQGERNPFVPPRYDILQIDFNVHTPDPRSWQGKDATITITLPKDMPWCSLIPGLCKGLQEIGAGVGAEQLMWDPVGTKITHGHGGNQCPAACVGCICWTSATARLNQQGATEIVLVVPSSSAAKWVTAGVALGTDAAVMGRVLLAPAPPTPQGASWCGTSWAQANTAYCNYIHGQGPMGTVCQTKGDCPTGQDCSGSLGLNCQ